MGIFCVSLPHYLYAQGNPVNFENEFSELTQLKIKHQESNASPISKTNLKDTKNRLYDVTFYKLEVNVYYDPDQISGKLTMKSTALDSQLQHILLDFHDNMKISAVSENIVSYQHNGFSLILNLNKPIPPDSNFTIWIRYNGLPQAGNNNYFRFDTFPDGSRSVWSLSESYGAKYWWPCKDTPQDKADSVDIILTVPNNQIAVSNGLLAEKRNHGDSTTYYWKERYPITTYLVSLAAGAYTHFRDYFQYSQDDSMPLDYYIYPEDLNEAKIAFAEMKDFLEGLRSFLGEYPFIREKYGHVQFGWGGGMEHQTITSIGKVSNSIGWKYLYVHELGHQWFGDQVTCASWQDIWLNEGFASYTEALYAEWKGFYDLPPGPESYHAYMTTQKYLGDRTIAVDDTTDESNIFHPIVYNKGSWVLHMLRRIMGNEKFFQALRQYINDPRWTYGSVYTRNFEETCEEVWGKSLQSFFDQWLFYPYYPQYEYSWNAINNSTGSRSRIELTIEQTQTNIVYEMPIDLQIVFSDGKDTLITVQNNRRSQTYLFELSKRVMSVNFDPQDWILKSFTELPGEPYSAELFIKNVYPNPGKNIFRMEVINWDLQPSQLNIYTILGQLVATIQPENKKMYTDYYQWDGKNNMGIPIASGTYILRPILISNGKNITGLPKKLAIFR